MPQSIPSHTGRSQLRLGFRLICCLCLLSLFTLPLAAQDAPTITISPESGEVEVALLTIEIDGLEANEIVTVEFVFEGEVVFASEETSDENGHISYPAGSTAGDLPGTYTVQVLRDGEVLATAEFELTASADDPLPGVVAVSPADGPIGAIHTVTITELEPQSQYTVEITASATLHVGYRRQHTSDDDGMIEIEVFAEAGDSPGQQAIAVYDEDGELFAQGEFMIDAPPERDILVSVNPPTAPAGQAFEIQLSGLAPFDNISAEIMSADDQPIDTVFARASNAGEATLTFNAPADLAKGLYSIKIRDQTNDERLASASLEIVAEEADATDTDDIATGDDSEFTEEPEADKAEDNQAIASASIEPQTALIGSSHLITVRDLSPNEAVAFEVTFEGRTVYSTDKTADEDGTILLELVTTAGDKAGDYIITVIRESGQQPSTTLTATTVAIADIGPKLIAADADVINGSLIEGSATFSIAAQADQYLRITVSSDDFDPAATLYDPFGFAITHNDDSRHRNDASIGPLKMPESGNYQLEIFPSPGQVGRPIIEGEFAVSVQTVSVMPIRYDSDIPFALSPSAPELYYELPVETGDSLSVNIDSGGALDTLMQVIAPDGYEYAFDDDGGYGFDAEFSHLIFDRTANYILAVTTFAGNASGSGTLTLTRNPVHALEDGDTIINLNDKLIHDLVVFDAVEDEMLILHLDKLAGDVEDLFVTAKIEGMEVMSYSAMGVPDELPLAFVMPMSGRVVVTLEKFGQDDGISLGVSLERP